MPHKQGIDFGFLGISYLTFKTVQVVMELRDGTIKQVDPVMYARFLLFFPTISSGPIDRYRRFVKDYDKAPSREDYIKDLSYAVRYLFQGVLYKFLLGWFFGTYCLHTLSSRPSWPGGCILCTCLGGF